MSTSQTVLLNLLQVRSAVFWAIAEPILPRTRPPSARAPLAHLTFGLCAPICAGAQEAPSADGDGAPSCGSHEVIHGPFLAFSARLMHGLGGMATQLKREKVPSTSRTGQPSQSATLEQFARSLSKDQLRAVTVDGPERGLEGNWWLCLILGPASQATARQAHATELFEEGWWIVRIKWYKYVPGTSPRKYTLLNNSTRWLSVSAIIRVDGLAFEGGDRVLKSGATFSHDLASLIGECM